VVEAALARGHDLTLFNRGETNPELFPEAEKLRGDRDGDLGALEGRTWDAVVDVAGYLPRVVRQSVEAIDSPYYLFVSTLSVYASFDGPYDENAPIRGDVESEEIMENYGELKAMCERVVEQRAGAIVRPGLIVGPHDPTGRFTYWPHRVARGGNILAPGAPTDPVELIDVRDLGEWIVRLCEARTTGVYNVVNRSTWGELLDATVRAVGADDAELTWVPSERLLEAGVGEWMELPLWVASGELGGIHLASNERAVAAGLTFRSLEETARATLDHAETTDAAGLTATREADLLSELASLESKA
jgi:2'-hydroxyisoflavone reductase